MKSLILVFITIFSVSGFAWEQTCTIGDRDCEQTLSNNGAKAVVLGVGDCPDCRAMLTGKPVVRQPLRPTNTGKAGLPSSSPTNPGNVNEAN